MADPEIVSGPAGRETVHYEAPPADRVTAEMQRLLDWFNQYEQSDRLVQAALVLEALGGVVREDVVDVAGAEVLVPLLLLELQPVRASAAATPATAMDTVLLRMRSPAFRVGQWSGR